MDRLFRCRSLIPDIHANGGRLWFSDYSNYADDHSLVIFLLRQFKKRDLSLHLLPYFLQLSKASSSSRVPQNFFHGGFVAVLMAALIIAIMLIWEWGNHIQEQAAEEVDLDRIHSPTTGIAE